MTARTQKSQKHRVLAILRARGARGTHRLEWTGPVIDGGSPILHLAGRIDELRNDGHIIESHHSRHDQIVTYVLVTAADEDRRKPAMRADVDVDLSDFELTLPAPPEPSGSGMCSCARALPRPCADGQLRCARCERRTNGWQW